MAALQIVLGLIGAAYWIVGAYLVVTGRDVPDWVLWPFKNQHTKRQVQFYGAMMLILGLVLDLIAFSVAASFAVALGSAVIGLIAIAAVVFLFGGLAFLRRPPAGVPAKQR